MNIILDKIPSFTEQWQAHLDYWDGEEAGLGNDLSEFAKYVTNLMIKHQETELPTIFNLIEELMIDGDEEVKNAVATCFLENLLNRVSYQTISPQTFVHFLGTESRNYCKAWDEFTGVHTEGL